MSQNQQDRIATGTQASKTVRWVVGIGVTILLTIRMTVVFPEPESPITTVIFADGTVSEKLFSAVMSPYFFDTRSNSITWKIRCVNQAALTVTPRQNAT